jgi:hypothetical protein
MSFIDSESRIEFARTTRRVVVWVVTVLAIIFTLIQIKDITPNDLITPIASGIMWRSALIAYFWCWRHGCIFDTDIQELAYAYLPHGGRWRWQSYGIVAILVILAGALVLTYGDMRLFAVTITAFFFVDHGGWRFLVNELAPYAQKSEEEFTRTGDYFAMERLRVVRSQIEGQWKWWRGVFGAVVIIAIDLFAFIPQVRELLVQPVQLLKPNISAADADIFVFSSLILLFVALMEAWHYLMRLRTMFWLQYIQQLRDRYSLLKK